MSGDRSTISYPLPDEPSIPPDYSDVRTAHGKPDLRPGGPIAEHGHNVFLGHSPVSSLSQSQNAGMYGQQTTVNKEADAFSNRGISISSSGRSLSPKEAEAKRQEENERARRRTAKRDSEKKAHEGDGKKPGDSRQKNADKAKGGSEKKVHEGDGKKSGDSSKKKADKDQTKHSHRPSPK